MADLWARMPADHAVAVYTMLDGLARAAHGEPGETRTLDQLRADTLGEIALGVLDGNGWAGRTLAPRRRVHPHLHVTVGADTLLGASHEPGWLAGYGPIPAAMARRIAGGATWRRLLTDPVTGKLLDYGTDTYTPGAVLDAHVTSPGPELPVPHLHPPRHRLRPGPHGAPSGRAHRRGQPRGPVPAHHRAKQAGWNLTQDRPGQFTWTSPTGATHTVPPAALATPHPDGNQRLRPPPRT